MAIVTDFVAELNSITEVSDANATVSPQVSKGVFPAIVYDIVDGIRDLGYKGGFGLRTTQFNVSIYTKNYEQLQTLKNAIVEHFNGFSGPLNTDGHLASVIEVTNVLETYETGTENLHRVIIQLEIRD